MRVTTSISVAAFAFVGGLLVAGCYGPGGGDEEPECGKDIDCDGNEICNDDNECVDPNGSGTNNGTGGDAMTGGDGFTPDGGNGGNGGDDGGGNGTGSPTGKYCVKECSAPEDCGNNADNWKCEGGVCKPDLCTTDSDCVPVLSGWQMEGCSSGGCGTGQVCIQHDGSTYCALEPREGSCTFGAKTQKTKAGTNESVDVCAKTGGTCRESACWTSDSGCEKDADCSDTKGADKCYDGFCGCTDDNTCSSLGSDYTCASP